MAYSFGPVSYTHLLDLKGLGIDNLYDSQKDAIWMDKLLGGGIIDHEVLRP